MLRTKMNEKVGDSLRRDFLPKKVNGRHLGDF